MRAVFITLLAVSITASASAAPPLWPPTGYVPLQPVRNFWRFCGDCQLRQAERVEAIRAWRELKRRQREQQQGGT